VVEELHFIVTAILVGLIWTVQVVHYPSFAFVEKSRFSEFETFHSLRISVIVMPLMLTELGSALWLLGRGERVYYISGAVLLLIWAVTFFVSVPCHKSLAKGFDAQQWRRLVASNWLRTLGWSTRLLLLIFWEGDNV
jgi:hypothetical protein